MIMADDQPTQNETNVTDIELMPDGRIFVFGTSRQVLDVLNELQTARDGEISSRLETCGQTRPPQSIHQTDADSTS